MLKQTEQKLEKPVWLKTSIEEIEEIAANLAKQGYTTEKIGLILRDQYGVPTTRVLGKKLGQILREKGVYSDASAANAEKKFERIKKHLEIHPNDKKSKRVLETRTARVRKLQSYKKRKSKQ